MMYSYPVTKYDLSPIADLSDSNERENISEGALRAFFNIMSCWKIKDEDARNLLGGLSSGAFYKYKKDMQRSLDQDKLIRISYLIGIFKALNILHSESLADKWVSLSNRNRIFQGKSPKDYMIKGGAPAMQTVRRLLDARRGGM